MASESEFASVPAWPADVPTLCLPRIPLRKLQAHDPDEEQRVFNSCRRLGFFLLDLSGCDTGAALMADLAALLDISRQYMAQPESAKLAYAVDPPGRLLGYKQMGYTAVDGNHRDRCEIFGLGEDELHDADPHVPGLIRERLNAFRSYVDHARDIIRVIYGIFDREFQLPAGSFWEKQRVGEASGTLFRLIRLPPCEVDEHKRASMVSHTDFGTITLLMNVLGGLQVLEPGKENVQENWKYVKPEPNCLIVNMGDALVEWSGGVLRSNMHRVTYAPGDQSKHYRYSIAYQVRAAKNVDMKRFQRGLIPELEDGEKDTEDLAYAWEQKKSMAIIKNTNLVGSKGGKPLKGESR